MKVKKSGKYRGNVRAKGFGDLSRKSIRCCALKRVKTVQSMQVLTPHTHGRGLESSP